MKSNLKRFSPLWISVVVFTFANCGGPVGGSDVINDPVDPDTKSEDLTKMDSDHDGISDAQEIARGTDPKKEDTDGDTLKDGQELALGSSPLNRDSDCDSLGDQNDPGNSKLSDFIMDTSDASKWRALRFDDHFRIDPSYTLPSFSGENFIIGNLPGTYSFEATANCSNAPGLVGTAGGTIWGNPNCTGGAYWFRGTFELPELRATRVHSVVLEHLAADDVAKNLRFNGRELLGFIGDRPILPRRFEQSAYGWVAPENNKIVLGIEVHDAYAPVGALALRAKAVYEHFYSVDSCPAL